MAKLRLTKNELKKQKDTLKRFTKYLPMLQLKKQQLRLEVSKIYHLIDEAAVELDSLRKEVVRWVDVFAQDVGLDKLLSVKSIKTETGNIAGVDIPSFGEVEFNQRSYDLLLTPLWVDKAIEVCKHTMTLKAKLLVYYRQMGILKEELRVAAQRVNLFEKVKIPESKENIRIISIYLGELQTAEVVRGKIAKAKLEKVVQQDTLLGRSVILR
ncbi:MAG: V-type ATP synthase subunit D [Candidatus Omnitrophica bacterium]|nr:V-type ATP synthase subunit D [Candidatus Omnitrophota bacterium]MBU0878789.1 V-type ATP synthase subunit D [Candidatus Omnitrophota bacterium]MBU1134168.1 V-type ATP synthase subunit D [Candidatus Omnitrophota bacterium]MBU1810910.1 V-type ATP synthase subunit D [Candidatus Omnitrophota bacterium]